MPRRRLTRAVAATALAATVAGLAGTAQPASAAPIVLNWTADVDSQIGGLINQTLELPEGTFSGEVDLGSGGLEGDTTCPPAR
jgi:hypothetical protein